MQILRIKNNRYVYCNIWNEKDWIFIEQNCIFFYNGYLSILYMLRFLVSCYRFSTVITETYVIKHSLHRTKNSVSTRCTCTVNNIALGIFYCDHSQLGSHWQLRDCYKKKGARSMSGRGISLVKTRGGGNVFVATGHTIPTINQSIPPLFM